MITAVDSSILIDIFRPDPRFAPLSRDALKQCRAEGSVIACDVTWAEVSARFGSASGAQRALARLEIAFSPTRERAAFIAGDAWRRYRARGGPRDRIVADFLIGANALTQADRLLTRDRGFYRVYFPDLDILDPTNA